MSLHTADEVAGRVARMGQAGHAHDCVTDPMDGYCANADDAAKAWGSPDSPETKAAYILGCSLGPVNTNREDHPRRAQS